jgi:hypothetical protein
MIHVRMNHKTNLLRVVVNGYTLGRFEEVQLVDGPRGKRLLCADYDPEDANVRVIREEVEL